MPHIETTLFGLAVTGRSAALTGFIGYTLAVLVLAWLSHRLLASRQFLSEYYLGSRGLGVVAFTLTFGATAASAGSFAGFPALIYAHGWVLALWIASYMVVPICTMGLLGKRLNQVSRRSGAITLPDILRERFQSPATSLTATVLMVFLLAFFLIPQFKLGAIILSQLLTDVPLLHDATAALGNLTQRSVLLSGIDPEYIICLLLFGVLVILYTTYGGFRAVVWTDVMQGVVMVFGVVVLLTLILWRVGGLAKATQQLAEITTPRVGTAYFSRQVAHNEDVRIPADTWFTVPHDGDSRRDDEAMQIRLLRTNESATISAGANQSKSVMVVELTSPAEITRVTSAWPDRTPPPLSADIVPHIDELRDYAYGADQPGVYLTAPGPSASSAMGFLPLGMAVSFFAYWALAGAGQPASMVRLMAFDSARTLRRSIAALTVYFGMIYFPLVVIFCCARIVVPALDQTPDRIMPAVTFELANGIGAPWLAGLLIAAPFAAAMSTVDSLMLLISSAVVRDIYQHTINPQASEQRIRRLSYLCMTLVGVVVLCGALNPPKFLQYLIVFAGGGLSVTFLIPVALALYWPRVNAPGIITSMVSGLSVYIVLYLMGFLVHGRTQPYLLLGLDPFLWGSAASLACGVVVSRLTTPPPEHLVHKFFYVDDRSESEDS